LTLDPGDNVTMELVLIITGKFVMGNPEAYADQVRHGVTITKPCTTWHLRSDARVVSQARHDPGGVFPAAAGVRAGTFKSAHRAFEHDISHAEGVCRGVRRRDGR